MCLMHRLRTGLTDSAKQRVGQVSSCRTAPNHPARRYPPPYSAANRGASTIPTAACKSADISRDTPRSCIVTPYSRSIRAIVSGWCATTRNQVSSPHLAGRRAGPCMCPAPQGGMRIAAAIAVAQRAARLTGPHS